MMRPPEEHPAGEPTAEDYEDRSLRIYESRYWSIDTHKAREHDGHNVALISYSIHNQNGQRSGGNMALECEDCYEVIGDIYWRY